MLKQITKELLNGKGVIGQPDTPGLSVAEMQKSIEQIPREVIIPVFNENAEAQNIENSNRYTKAETDEQINLKVVEIGAGDMTKHEYAGSGSGVVAKADDALKLGGQLPDYYAAAESVNEKMPKSGGTFTGQAVAVNENSSNAALRNIEVRTADTVGQLQATGKIIMVRK